MPARVQRRRTKGWRLPPGAVIVDRSSRWGNPYRAYDSSAREHLIAASQFALLLAGRADFPHPDLLMPYPPDEEIRAELGGRDLACWCPPEHACHGDVLLAVANGLPMPRLLNDEAIFLALMVKGRPSGA
ncbi:DUF4326 domain-containing protein [Streptodolium elevatio]|uniref:DUF4326 domain-containing protein n=1 Tax=Streptodolium elevatio TaxID=3157996 RepID=A0ABV3DJZ2_9ACTN